MSPDGIDHFEAIKDVNLFVCNILYKAMHSRSNTINNIVPVTDKYSKKDFRMLKILNELLAESSPFDLIETIDLEDILDTVDRET